MKTSTRSKVPSGMSSGTPAGSHAAAMALLPPRVRVAASTYRQGSVSALASWRQRRVC